MNEIELEREICSDCGISFDMYDGFLGNPDQTDTSCCFMSNIVALCASCAEDRGIVLHDDEHDK